MSDLNDNELNGPSSNQGSAIDFKRVLSRAIRSWYIIAASLIVSLGIAFYKNRYSIPIYPVSASIIIRETEETGGGEFVYKNSLIEPYRNYLNELYIIRSFPLIEKVVKDLGFDVTFYRQGYILTSETYGNLPMKVTRLGNTSMGADFSFRIADEGHFELGNFGDEITPLKTFAFGDTISWDAQRFLIKRVADTEVTNLKGVSFMMRFQRPIDVAGGYVGGLYVDWAQEGASVVNLAVSGPIPAKQTDFLNGLVKHYQQLDLDKKNQAAEGTITFIKQQLKSITDSLKIFEKQLVHFRSNHSSSDLGEESKRLLGKAEALDIQKAEMDIKQNYYKYVEDYIKKSDNLDQIILPSAVGLSDPVISALITRMIDLQLDIKLYVGRENQNPLVKEKIDRINNIKKDLLESVRAMRSTDKIRTSFINDQLGKISQLMESMPLTEQQLVSIQRNYSLQENLYLFLMQKMSEASISKASSTSDIVMVNPPMTGGQTYPRKDQNILMAVAIGLMFPFGLFVLLELLNNKVQSKEDIDKITTIPFIGGIGHKKSVNNLEVFNSPKSVIAESFRALRSNLNFFIGTKNSVVFLVTSSISGEGKTFTSLNLASIFSLSGKRTLVVGADMRKPKLYQDFQLSNEKGLSTFLSGIDTFEGVVQRTAFDHLDLISGGPVPPNPSELLLNGQMGEFIQEAKSRYDFIIIDTPPMAIVTDALAMTPFADHTVFLVRQNYTPKALVKTAHDFYASGKLKNMSIVLNDIFKSGLGYGYGGYGYDYYSYGYGYGYGKKKNGDGYYTE